MLPASFQIFHTPHFIISVKKKKKHHYNCISQSLMCHLLLHRLCFGSLASSLPTSQTYPPLHTLEIMNSMENILCQFYDSKNAILEFQLEHFLWDAGSPVHMNIAWYFSFQCTVCLHNPFMVSNCYLICLFFYVSISVNIRFLEDNLSYLSKYFLCLWN